MYRKYRQNKGQFVPLTAMMMFAMVAFLIAALNIYFVTRAKLKLQNLADAAAMNLASQQAQAYNLIADKNEWLNHMLEGIKSPNDPDAPNDVKDCSIYQGYPNTPKLLPGISCVENDGEPGRMDELLRRDPPSTVFLRHIFFSRDGAINYGMVIHTVNQAQKLFIEAYNSFLGAPTIGAGAQSSNASTRNFSELLKRDIPELKDPGIRLVAWNTQEGEEQATSRMAELEEEGEKEEGTLDSKAMVRMEFKVHHDIKIRHYIHRYGSDHGEIMANTLGGILYGCAEGYDTGDSMYPDCGPLNPNPTQHVGWMVPTDPKPQLRVGEKTVTGVGVIVEKTLKLPVLGMRTVTARSKAYLVDKSHEKEPAFKPTYWVKLGR